MLTGDVEQRAVGRAGQPAKPLSKVHLPALDGLRGLAILAVMVNHYGSFVFTGFSFWQQWLAKGAKRGYLGVDLFFVLSGFLITGILIDARGSDNYLQRFYWRRSLRIFPLYFFYLSLVFFVIRPVFPDHFTGVTSLWYFTYLANWHMAREMLNPFLAHLWSLAVEEQFYIAWPFVVLFVPPRRLAWFCGAVMAAALIFRLILVGKIDPNYIYILTPSRMDALAAGALMALAMRQQKLGALVNRVKWPVAAACAVLWISTLDTYIGNSLGYSAACIFFAMIVFWAAKFAPVALQAAPLRLMGKYSYGIYIFHVLPRNTIYWHAKTLLPGAAYKVVFPICTMLVTFGLAFLSWKFLETPFLRLKDRFRSLD